MPHALPEEPARQYGYNHEDRNLLTSLRPLRKAYFPFLELIGLEGNYIAERECLAAADFPDLLSVRFSIYHAHSLCNEAWKLKMRSSVLQPLPEGELDRGQAVQAAHYGEQEEDDEAAQTALTVGRQLGN